MELLTILPYVPLSAAPMVLMVKALLVAPAILVPANCHRYVRFALPVALLVSNKALPNATLVLAGGAVLIAAAPVTCAQLVLNRKSSMRSTLGVKVARS